MEVVCSQLLMHYTKITFCDLFNVIAFLSFSSGAFKTFALSSSSIRDQMKMDLTNT